MATRATLFLLALFFLSSSPIFANDWEKIDEEDGIKVFKKEVKDSPIVAFKGDTIIDAPLQKVLWVLIDNEHRKEWVDRLEKSSTLEKISDFEYVVYQHFKLPWFLSDRDYVYRGKAFTEKQTGKVYLKLQSEPHKKAPESVGVRAQLVRSAYILTPVEKGKKTRIEVEILTDPKGWIPAWFVNLIQESWPLKTLKGVREQTKKSYVKLHPMPPIQEAKAAKAAKPPAKAGG